MSNTEIIYCDTKTRVYADPRELEGTITVDGIEVGVEITEMYAPSMREAELLFIVPNDIEDPVVWKLDAIAASWGLKRLDWDCLLDGKNTHDVITYGTGEEQEWDWT